MVKHVVLTNWNRMRAPQNSIVRFSIGAIPLPWKQTSAYVTVTI